MTNIDSDHNNSSIPIEIIRDTVDNWRSIACLQIYKGVKSKGSINKSGSALFADKIEKQASVLVRKIERLIVLLEQGQSDISTISLPPNWTMTNLEDALKELGVVSQQRPYGKDDGTGRRPPPMEY